MHLLTLGAFWLIKPDSPAPFLTSKCTFWRSVLSDECEPAEGGNVAVMS